MICHSYFFAVRLFSDQHRLKSQWVSPIKLIVLKAGQKASTSSGVRLIQSLLNLTRLFKCVWVLSVLSILPRFLSIVNSNILNVYLLIYIYGSWIDESHHCGWVFPFQSLIIMTSSNGNIFRVTGHLREEFNGEFPAQRPAMRSIDVFFDLCLNKRLSKQWKGWWFETLSRPLWRHCND